jgi:hypothetical protein
VYTGILRKREEVAIKVMKDMSPENIAEFQKEFRIMRYERKRERKKE